MNEHLQAVLMILLTIVLCYISKKIQDRYDNPLLNPALIALIVIIIVLLVCGVSYKGYMKGSAWINHVLNAAVVRLAYPSYQNKKKVKKYLTVTFTSVLIGVVLNLVLVFTTLKAFGYSKDIVVTLLPRSITTAVGIEVFQELGGTGTITVFFIMTTGLIGSILGSMPLRTEGFRSPIARGLAYGNASHAFGTAKALELDIESRAFSSIGIILTTVISSALILVLISLFY